MGFYITVLITAAGLGTRMGTEKGKLFLEIGDKTVIERTLEAFDDIDEIDDLIVVIRKEDEMMMKRIAQSMKKPMKFVYGGNSREESTFNGLQALSDQCNIVMCHDGARPFIKRETIIECIHQIKTNKGVIVAVPVKDTIKNINAQGYVDFTPKRELLYQVQTPQVFHKETILSAYELIKEENIKVTDDSSLVEKMGEKVKMVIGDYTNIKITTKEDIIIGERIIEKEGLV